MMSIDRQEIVPQDAFPSVRQRKLLFERALGNPVGSRSSGSDDSPRGEPPPKPPRTFDHDIYCASKVAPPAGQGGPQLRVCRPIPVPRPAQNRISQRPAKPPPPVPNEKVRGSSGGGARTIQPIRESSEELKESLATDMGGVGNGGEPMNVEKDGKRPLIGSQSGYRHLYACLEGSLDASKGEHTNTLLAYLPYPH